MIFGRIRERDFGISVRPVAIYVATVSLCHWLLNRRQWAAIGQTTNRHSTHSSDGQRTNRSQPLTPDADERLHASLWIESEVTVVGGRAVIHCERNVKKNVREQGCLWEFFLRQQNCRCPFYRRRIDRNGRNGSQEEKRQTRTLNSRVSWG